MPNLELTFSIEGETQLIRRLQDIDKDLKDWTPEFKKVGNLLLKTFRENFQTQGRTLGENWPPLAPSTIAQKQRMGYPLTPLVRKGTLRDSFKSETGKFDVVIANPVSYFPYHQSSKARHKIPRRVMMKIDNKRKELISKIFITAVQTTLQQRGFKQ